MYLNQFYVSRTPDTQFTTYLGIHNGHNKTLPYIREEMQLWLQDGDHGLYYEMLQVEESAEICWLLSLLKKWTHTHQLMRLKIYLG